MMAQNYTNDTTAPDPNQDPLVSPYGKLRQFKGYRAYGVDDKESLENLMALNPPTITGGEDVASRRYGIQYITGDVLFDDEGYVVRGKYLEDQETAEQQMLKFSPADLATLAKQLQRTGFYTSGDPSGLILNKRGYSITDVGAFVNFLRFANQRGFIVQSLSKVLSTLSTVAGDGGTKVKVTADEDVKYYLEQAFYSRLGRAPRKSEIDAAVKAIQDNERKAAAASRNQPSVAAASMAQADKMNPGEKAAYQLGNAIKLAFAALGAES